MRPQSNRVEREEIYATSFVLRSPYFRESQSLESAKLFSVVIFHFSTPICPKYSSRLFEFTLRIFLSPSQLAPARR